MTGAWVPGEGRWRGACGSSSSRSPSCARRDASERERLRRAPRLPSLADAAAVLPTRATWRRLPAIARRQLHCCTSCNAHCRAVFVCMCSRHACSMLVVVVNASLDAWARHVCVQHAKSPSCNAGRRPRVAVLCGLSRIVISIYPFVADTNLPPALYTNFAERNKLKRAQLSGSSRGVPSSLSGRVWEGLAPPKEITSGSWVYFRSFFVL